MHLSSVLEKPAAPQIVTRRLSADDRELEKIMEQRRNYRYVPGEAQLRATDGADKYHLGVAAPILSQGDLMGCVMLLMGEDRTPMAEADQRLAQTVAGFLGKQMES